MSISGSSRVLLEQQGSQPNDDMLSPVATSLNCSSLVLSSVQRKRRGPEHSTECAVHPCIKAAQMLVTPGLPGR